MLKVNVPACREHCHAMRDCSPDSALTPSNWAVWQNAVCRQARSFSICFAGKLTGTLLGAGFGLVPFLPFTCEQPSQVKTTQFFRRRQCVLVSWWSNFLCLCWFDRWSKLSQGRMIKPVKTPGSKWLSQVPYKHSRFMVGLNNLKGLFQPEWLLTLYDGLSRDRWESLLPFL